MSDPMVVRVKSSRAKVIGAVLCMAATIGCFAGAAAQGTGGAVIGGVSAFLFLVGLGTFVVGRMQQ